MLGALSSLTGGGGLSSSESGDAVSGVGGVHQTFHAPNGSPFRDRSMLFGLEGKHLVTIAALAAAAFVVVRWVR